jgi:hypothetical protein
MSWRDTWEHVRDGIPHPQGAEEKQAALEERIRKEKWDRALHQADLSSGSETLDD